MNRSEKEEKVKELKKLIDSNSVVGVLDLAKIPGSVQLKVKNALKDVSIIKMSRKSVLLRALKESNKYNEEFCKKLSGSCALIFSNENPFRLFKLLKSNTVKSSAKIGQISPKDISVPAGQTPIPPGPAISTFQKAGLKTKVEAGKIAVISEKVIVKQGDAINADIVAILNLLKIEPIEISISLDHVLEDGLIYAKDVLDVSTEDLLNQVASCVQQAINLSVNANYTTKISIEIMIQKAFNHAKSLAVEANILENEFIGDILAKAVREAKSIESLTDVN